MSGEDTPTGIYRRFLSAYRSFFFRAEEAALRAWLAEHQPTAYEILVVYYHLRHEDWPKLTLAKYLRAIGQEKRENYIRKKKVIFDQQRKQVRGGNTLGNTFHGNMR
jgi:hypothetical protein